MLLRKMLRDMKLHKMQFVTIFLMAFLGVYVYSGIGGEWYGIEHVRDKYYKESNLADAWIYGDKFDSTAVSAVQKVDGVINAQRRLSIDAFGTDDRMPTIHMKFVENNEISKPSIVDGRAFDAKDPDSIWIDKRYAAANNLQLGDTFSVNINGTEMVKTIAGFILGSEYGYYSGSKDLFPDFSMTGYAYCSVKAFPIRAFIINSVKNNTITTEDFVDKAGPAFLNSLKESGLTKDMITQEILINILMKLDDADVEKMLPYTEILIKTDRKDTLKLEEDLGNALNGGYGAFITREDFPGISTLDGEVQQHKAMGNVFPIAFITIALLAIITTMSRLVNQQRTQLGTLKALGFSNGRIIRHYLSYGFFLSLLGSFAGSIVGPLTLPNLFYPSMSSMYTLPEWKPAISPMFLLVALITTLACTTATYFSCRKLVKDMPAETLRTKAPGIIKRSSLKNNKFWEKLSFRAKWNLRDISRSKVKTAMGFVGTMSCMALLICAFAMYDTMNDMKTWMYNEIQNYNTQLVFNEDINLAEAESIAADIQGELLMTDAVEVKANNRKKTYSITVTEGTDLYQLNNVKRQTIALKDGEIALSKKAADILGVQEGDTITWHLFGEERWTASSVTVLNRVPIGQGITITREAFEDLGYEFIPTSAISMEKISSYDNDNIISVFNRDQLLAAWDTQMQAMNIMVYVMIMAAALLAVVVLYNLGLLSFTEREKELATLKVIGFASKKIRLLLMVQNIWLALLGSMAGIPVGIWILELMLNTAGQDFDMMIALSLQSALLSAAITFGLSILVNLMFSQKIKKLDMVSSLKGME